MATSVYFNNFSPSVINENMLLEDLIVESIQIMGHDVKYLPREVYDQADDVGMGLCLDLCGAGMGAIRYRLGPN